MNSRAARISTSCVETTRRTGCILTTKKWLKENTANRTSFSNPETRWWCHDFVTPATDGNLFWPSDLPLLSCSNSVFANSGPGILVEGLLNQAMRSSVDRGTGGPPSPSPCPKTRARCSGCSHAEAGERHLYNLAEWWAANRGAATETLAFLVRRRHDPGIRQRYCRSVQQHRFVDLNLRGVPRSRMEIHQELRHSATG